MSVRHRWTADAAPTGAAEHACGTRDRCNRIHRWTSGARPRSLGDSPSLSRPPSGSAQVPCRIDALRSSPEISSSLRRSIAALAGIDVAYYLVHSMGAHGNYREKDCAAARNFGAAARRAGVRRIVYLGGLAAGDEALSAHLESRLETGRILRDSGVPVVEFRASVVIGSGSLSFELIRALVERLPIVTSARAGVSTLAQPIGIDDVLAYLAGALNLPDGESRTFEIGGADRASYGDVMRQYARQRGLRRVMISVPLLTPRLSSLWLGSRDPGLRTGWARTDCRLEERVRRHRFRCALRLPDPPRRPGRRDWPRHTLRGPSVRADAVVGRPLVGRRLGVAGRRQIRQQACRYTAPSRRG